MIFWSDAEISPEMVEISFYDYRPERLMALRSLSVVCLVLVVDSAVFFGLFDVLDEFLALFFQLFFGLSMANCRHNQK